MFKGWGVPIDLAVGGVLLNILEELMGTTWGSI